MLDTIKWIRGAVGTKDIVLGMTYYKVNNGQILATDGRVTAGHPWPTDDTFLVPGQEFEKIIARLAGRVVIEVGEQDLVIKAGRSRGTIQTLNPQDWDFPIIAEEEWNPVPDNLSDVLRALKPFISDNATQAWSQGITIQDGWAFATNNVALAGVQFPQAADVRAILPLWAIEFILNKSDKLQDWSWTEYYLAFRWENGAWMRSQLIDGVFPERAAALIQSAAQSNPMVEITDEFKEAFTRATLQNDGAVLISGSQITAAFGKAQFVEEFETPELEGVITKWGAKHLLPVIECADWWSPETYPKPTPFQGDGICGYIVGRSA